MAVQRHFLGWDAPVVQKVRDYLVPQPPHDPVDLRNTLVLVPTQHAGRRLREALTLFCAENGTYLLAPALHTPSRLLDSDSNTSPPPASPMDVAAVWSRLLMDIRLSDYPGLFPVPIATQDFRWALRTGRMLESLRQTLAEHGYSIRTVVEGFKDEIEELSRWVDMARLEESAVKQIEQLGLMDPCSLMLGHAEQPPIPPVDRIILACVPDPVPLSLTVLGRLADTIDVEVLVHAPETMDDHFDVWGRPWADKWTTERLPFLTSECTVKLASSPTGQALLALEVLESEQYRPGDAALGTPDSSVGPYLESALSDHGVSAHNPAGLPLARHPIFRLLSAYHELNRDGSYDSLSNLLRHPDLLDHLRHAHGIGTQALLTELDRFQNAHLPGTAREIRERLRQSRESAAVWPMLTRALAMITELTEKTRAEGAETMLRTVLQAVYSTKPLHPEADADKEFRTVAERIDEALRLVSSGCILQLELQTHECCEVMLDLLAQDRYSRERPDGAIDLEGWLELAWNDAPLLIITGMNDGAVPQRLGNDAFMPESLRRTLGLRNESDRFARDLFLTRTMVESRRDCGRLYAIAGKYGPGGEPLKPSRILLRCDDDELPMRARRLFGDPDDTQSSVPSTISFTLNPAIPAAEDSSVQPPRRLSVTSLRDYLSCPFRFYLKHVLRMEPLADTKRELDALDFGTVAHEALAAMAADAAMRCCGDSHMLRRFLNDQIDKWKDEHLGAHPPLHLSLQLDVIRDRLAAAADVQAAQVPEWEIIHAEERVEMTISSLIIRGRIDRIERHRQTGEVRILDYKTTETPDPPAKQHLAADRDDARACSRVLIGGKARRWIDLQLPLYVKMIAEQLPHAGGISSGYFNLPRDTDATRIDTWDDLSGPLLESAMTCVRGIVDDIENHRFWPPSTRVPYEEFESLFPAEAAHCVDSQTFTDFLEGWKR